MSTAGVADMPSTNLLEMMFCSFILILGCQTINAVMGSIASLMGNINMEKRNFQNKMAQVQKIIKFRNIPPEIERRIIYFFEYQFSRTAGANEVEVLAGLPQPLREEVVKYVAGSVLVKIPFFNDCIEPMLEMILGLLSHRLFLEGDDLMTAGEHGREMFVIESGTIVVTSADKKIVYATLGSGSYIGESCLLKVAKRTASAHARDYSDTYVLNKEDFQKVLEAFPGEGEIVVEGIEAVLAEKKRKNEEMNRLRLERADSSAKTEEKNDDQSNSPVQKKPEPLLLDPEKEKHKFNWRKELETDSRSRRMWDSVLFFILMYNLVMVPFRIALSVYPPLYGLDFAFDLMLMLDSYLHCTWFRLSVGGKHVSDPERIRAAYMKNHFKQDFIARFPWDLIILFFLGQATNQILFIMPYLRIPKLVLMLKGVQQLGSMESLLEETNMTFVSMRMLQVHLRLSYCMHGTLPVLISV
jgi:CRP-like cAMP-binding protein